eukprot:Gb_05032 [translate_table: standard]
MAPVVISKLSSFPFQVTIGQGSTTGSHFCAVKKNIDLAQLQGGKLVKLISDDHPGLLEVKWCRNRFTPFLLLDPECAFDFQKQSQGVRDPKPHPMDPEEVIEVLAVDIPALKQIMIALGLLV